MTTSKKKAAPRTGDKAKRTSSKASGRTSQAIASGAATADVAETTPVVTAVTFAAPADAPPPSAAPAMAVSPRPLMVYEFQQRLAERGFYHGVVDGEYGPHTRMAVAACQQAHGLAVDGEPTAATLKALGF
jgi:peptidoglycan hydrolase-like protein with peptidoglycan-binding domain